MLSENQYELGLKTIAVFLEFHQAVERIKQGKGTRVVYVYHQFHGQRSYYFYNFEVFK